MVDKSDQIVAEATGSLQRVQSIDARDYTRADLGRSYNFEDVVSKIESVVDFFRQIPISAIYLLPRNQLNSIKSQADSFFNLLGEVNKFDEKQNNAIGVRDNLIQQVADRYQGIFDALYPVVSYLTSRVVDFGRLENDARAAIQGVEDKTNAVISSLAEKEKQADDILSEVRQVAAEQGVSQQATYFKDAADEYQKRADSWQSHTIWIAVALGVYGVLTLFMHKIPIIAPTSQFDTVQLLASKLIVFFVILFWLILASRNYLANRHNELVNRHRQRALLTFRALADAASDQKSQDIVLAQAAQCIFGSQETGFAKTSTSAPQVINGSVVDLLPTARALSHIAS